MGRGPGWGSGSQKVRVCGLNTKQDISTRDYGEHHQTSAMGGWISRLKNQARKKSSEERSEYLAQLCNFSRDFRENFEFNLEISSLWDQVGKRNHSLAGNTACEVKGR